MQNLDLIGIVCLFTGEDGGDMIWMIQPWLFYRIVSILAIGVLSLVYLRKYLGNRSIYIISAFISNQC